MLFRLFLVFALPPTVMKNSEMLTSMLANKAAASDSSMSRFTRTGNKLMYGLAGLVPILGIGVASHDVWSKTKRALGWKPKPLNKPATVSVQTQIPFRNENTILN